MSRVFRAVLAGDQWWPRTSGSRVRSVRAMTYFLRHRIGNFIKGNKMNQRLVKFSVYKAKSRQFPQATHMPTSRHFLGITAPQTYN